MFCWTLYSITYSMSQAKIYFLLYILVKKATALQFLLHTAATVVIWIVDQKSISQISVITSHHNWNKNLKSSPGLMRPKLTGCPSNLISYLSNPHSVSSSFIDLLIGTWMSPALPGYLLPALWDVHMPYFPILIRFLFQACLFWGASLIKLTVDIGGWLI